MFPSSFLQSSSIGLLPLVSVYMTSFSLCSLLPSSSLHLSASSPLVSVYMTSFSLCSLLPSSSLHLSASSLPGICVHDVLLIMFPSSFLQSSSIGLLPLVSVYMTSFSLCSLLPSSSLHLSASSPWYLCT